MGAWVWCGFASKKSNMLVLRKKIHPGMLCVACMHARAQVCILMLCVIDKDIVVC